MVGKITLAAGILAVLAVGTLSYKVRSLHQEVAQRGERIAVLRSESKACSGTVEALQEQITRQNALTRMLQREAEQNAVERGERALAQRQAEPVTPPATVTNREFTRWYSDRVQSLGW